MLDISLVLFMELKTKSLWEQEVYAVRFIKPGVYNKMDFPIAIYHFLKINK